MKLYRFIFEDLNGEIQQIEFDTLEEFELFLFNKYKTREKIIQIVGVFT